MMFSFGSMTVLTVAATNFAGMMALRWFLGKYHLVSLR